MPKELSRAINMDILSKKPPENTGGCLHLNQEQTKASFWVGYYSL